ncbi:MAG TPA: ribbon-helix-helix protein, CopG family [Chloroflexota bacterium]|nr:ribbon-helix-helix protein, CopG family [Chloroflexota bacterium]
MSSVITPGTTQISIRVPNDVLAQIDELAELMQRPRSYVVTAALRDFVQAELEDARIVAQEVADIETNPDVGVAHEDVLDWLIAHGSLTSEAVAAARQQRHVS